MLDVELIIKKIEEADEVEIMEYDFNECFTALREMHHALSVCKETFDFFREVRGCDGSLSDVVKTVDAVLGV